MCRSGCTLKLLTSQTRWYRLAASVQLFLDCEADAVMLQDTLFHFLAERLPTLRAHQGAKGFILYMT
jgi:hypothetical protein